MRVRVADRDVERHQGEEAPQVFGGSVTAEQLRETEKRWAAHRLVLTATRKRVDAEALHGILLVDALGRAVRARCAVIARDDDRWPTVENHYLGVDGGETERGGEAKAVLFGGGVRFQAHVLGL